MSPEQQIIASLLKRLEAKNRIIVAHQTGLPPKESTFAALAATEGIEMQATAWLTKGVSR